MAIVAILAIIANAGYSAIFDDLKIKKAIGDIYEIELLIERYNSQYNSLPNNLTDVDAPTEDPWGQPYAYLPFTPSTPNGPKRKSHGTVPLNSDYDLYSIGPDGTTATPLTSTHSKDDIVRAGNGGFVGLGADY